MRRLKQILEAMMDVYTFMVRMDRNVFQMTVNERNEVKKSGLTS